MKWSSVAIHVDCEWDPVTTSGIRDPVVHHIKCTIKKKIVFTKNFDFS